MLNIHCLSISMVFACPRGRQPRKTERDDIHQAQLNRRAMKRERKMKTDER